MKLRLSDFAVAGAKMPPTRGHDLKQPKLNGLYTQIDDAPHTGARLETGIIGILKTLKQRCPPHGGTT